MRFPKVKTPRDAKYLAWLRTQPCAFCGAPSPSEASHHGHHGVGLKPSDYGALPACRPCHARWHQHGSPHRKWDRLDKDGKRERFARLAVKYRRRYARLKGTDDDQ